MTTTPSNREFQLLAVLAPRDHQGEGPELSGREIAKTHEKETDEAVPYGMVHTFLSAMEEAGWVRSSQDLGDGHRTRYQLNPIGLDAVDRWRSASAAPAAETNDDSHAAHTAPKRTGS